MKKTIAVAMLLLSMTAWSVAQHRPIGIETRINFSFYTPSGKQMPAGEYEFRMSAGVPDSILYVLNMDTRQSLMVPVLTTTDKASSANGEVIFDKSGKREYLSEVFIPDMQGIILKDSPTGNARTVVRAN